MSRRQNRVFKARLQKVSICELIIIFETDEEVRSETNDADFSYKEVSDISDATEDIQAESLADQEVNELDDYQALVAATQKKLQLISDNQTNPSRPVSAQEKADEFLRNFFIKFGMKKTLDQFQTEWFELKATGELDMSKMPQIPLIYQQNQQLSDQLAILQEELDEARIIAEKARSTYDKLKKQRDF